MYLKPTVRGAFENLRVVARLFFACAADAVGAAWATESAYRLLPRSAPPPASLDSATAVREYADLLASLPAPPPATPAE
jgi:hypothetical protein